jgi:hypothetical protein
LYNRRCDGSAEVLAAGAAGAGARESCVNLAGLADLIGRAFAASGYFEVR